MRLLTFIIFLQLTCFLSAEIIPFPEGTKAKASFRCDKKADANALIDGNDKSWMRGSHGTCGKETQQTSVFINFPSPVKNLSGVQTGLSDNYGNYFPKEFEFYVDTNGDGRFDTFTGKTTKLGPGKKAQGKHPFNGTVATAYGLEVRCTRQNIGGAKRAWTMNSIALLNLNLKNNIKTTPYSYRQLDFLAPFPKDTEFKSSFTLEKNSSLKMLIDGDANTVYSAKNGTMAKGNRPASLYIKFKMPQKNLKGLKILGNDKFSNYSWQHMEILADTSGKGKYSKRAAKFTSNKVGELKFSQSIPVVYGLQLKVTKQKNAGGGRAFMLSEISDLIYADDGCDAEIRYVLEDFEDFGTWRTGALNTNQPEGERYFGEYVFFSGALRPDLAKDGQGVGIARYNFKEGKGPMKMWARRAKIFKQKGIMDSIDFWVNPQGFDGYVSFELNDAIGQKLTTQKVSISGNEWQQKSIPVTPKTLAKIANASYPLGLMHIVIEAKKPGKGEILFDNLGFTGAVDRTKRVTIRPVWEGLAYNPAKEVKAKYRFINSLPQDLTLPINIKLYESNIGDEKVFKELKSSVELKAYEHKTVELDMGKLPYGHYQAHISIESDKISSLLKDHIAVFIPNGKRINNKPMWIGSQHHESWTSAVENEFIFKQIAVKLGMDCYRTGSPAGSILETDLLMASGFGTVPQHLRVKKSKDGRVEPADYKKYSEWVKEEAQKKFAPYADRILSVEFYNEPDLPDFCYLPGIETYLKHWRAFAQGFKEGAPNVKLGTGSATVVHAHAKKDFNKRMYTELAKEADVAVWHAHGALDNYIKRHHLVENWSKDGGQEYSKIKMGNSEAAIPSGLTPSGYLRQAVNLVQKIGWAKSKRTSYFYTWFQTNEAHDQDIEASGDNNTWGLVDSNQRVKPSGQAMNELIRQLANTEPMGSVSIDRKLSGVLFTRENGNKVWLVWPNIAESKFQHNIASNTAVTVTTIFGNKKTIEPVEGNISLFVDGNPFYLEGTKDTKLSPAVIPTYVTLPKALTALPGEQISVPVSIKSTDSQDIKCSLEISSLSGKSLGLKNFILKASSEHKETFNITIPSKASFGTVNYTVKLKKGAKNIVLPLSITIPVSSLSYKEKSALKGPKITLKSKHSIQDLVDDPNTPYWSGENDLSATAQIANNDKGIFVSVEVKDQSHNPLSGKEAINGDSVTLAFKTADSHAELTLTNGAESWVYVHSQKDKEGKLTLNPKSSRSGNKTKYEVFIPYNWLGVNYQAKNLLNFSFLINENDGKGRVRVMKWFDGIESDKDINKFGVILLN